MTQRRDLSRGSIVSMHNMSQRQRNATFPSAGAQGIVGASPQRGEDDPTAHWALAPAGVRIGERVPSPRNSHVSRTLLCMDKGLCVTDLISLPVGIIDTEIVSHPESGCTELFVN